MSDRLVPYRQRAGVRVVAAGYADQAHAQLDAGLAAADALGDDGYGNMIRQGLDGLAQRVRQAEAAKR